MSERKPLNNHRTEEILKAFDRERSKADELHRRHSEDVRNSQARDKQVLIERRRHPR